MDMIFPSGDVTLPWTLWLKSLNQQLGFININTVNSRDAETEKRIIKDVASYGRQLGWITEVLDVLVSRVKFDDLTEEEKKSFNQFKELIKGVEQVKAKTSPPPLTKGNLNRMIEDIHALKKKDERAYREMVSMVKGAFEGEKEAA